MRNRRVHFYQNVDDSVQQISLQRSFRLFRAAATTQVTKVSLETIILLMSEKLENGQTKKNE